MQPDFYDDNDDDMTPEGLFDHDAIQEILEKVEDALRPLGLTADLRQVVLQAQPKGHVVAMLPVIIRPSAKKKLTEDRETQEQLNQMLAAQHDAEIKSQAEKIRNLAKDPEKLMEALFGDGVMDESDCEHVRHPSGFCLKCGDGMND